MRPYLVVKTSRIGRRGECILGCAGGCSRREDEFRAVNMSAVNNCNLSFHF